MAAKPIMKVNIIFIPVEKKTPAINSRERKLIAQVVKRHALRAAKLLRIKRHALTFTVHPFWWANASGGAESKEWVRLKIPLRWKSKGARLLHFEKILPGLVYHEMHHLARNYVFSPEKTYPPHRLANSLVSEGLAVAFSEEQVPTYKATYAAYRARQLRKWFRKIRAEKWSRNYDYQAWFHGKGKPRWLGYKIGKYIIDELKRRHPRLKALNLVHKDARTVLKLSGVKL